MTDVVRASVVAGLAWAALQLALGVLYLGEPERPWLTVLAMAVYVGLAALALRPAAVTRPLRRPTAYALGAGAVVVVALASASADTPPIGEHVIWAPRAAILLLGVLVFRGHRAVAVVAAVLSVPALLLPALLVDGPLALAPALLVVRVPIQWILLLLAVEAVVRRRAALVLALEERQLADRSAADAVAAQEAERESRLAALDREVLPLVRRIADGEQLGPEDRQAAGEVAGRLRRQLRGETPTAAPTAR